MNIHDVPQNVKDLWVWYGLTMLPRASRREWPWHHEKTRREQLMCDCVSASDEALALQIIELRGCDYLAIREKNSKLEKPVDKPKGRKKKRGKKNPDGEITLCDAALVYCHYHKEICDTRRLDPKDEKGWYGYLRTCQMGRSAGTEGKGGSDATINRMELPVEDVSNLVSL